MCQYTSIIWACGCKTDHQFDGCQAAILNLPCRVKETTHTVSQPCKAHRPIDPLDLDMGSSPSWTESSGDDTEEEELSLEEMQRKRDHAALIEEENATRAYEEAKASIWEQAYSLAEGPVENNAVEQLASPTPRAGQPRREDPSSSLSVEIVQAAAVENARRGKKTTRGWIYVDEDNMQPTEAEIFEDIAAGRREFTFDDSE